MNGRVGIVTGASSGIGRAAALALARRGCAVLGCARAASPEWGDVSGPGADRLAWASVDLSETDAIEPLFSAAEATFGRKPSIVVLSAGRGLRGSLLTSRPEDWRALVEINYLALMAQMRAAALYMTANATTFPVQDLMVIGSVVGRQVSAANPVYGSTKFAIHSLVEGLRQELCGQNIRVSLIEPGFVKSGFQDAAGYDPAWFAALEAEAGPFLEPEDVADTIAFVVDQPPRVHLDDIRIRPTRQRA